MKTLELLFLNLIYRKEYLVLALNKRKNISMNNTFEKSLLFDNENERLAKLYSYNIMNTYAQSGTFKHVACMAAHIFKVPIAAVNFVGKKIVLTNTGIGVDGYDKVFREISLCSLAILQKEVTVFENAKEEPCLLGNPIVHGEFGLQFYAGAPLKTVDGFNIGVIAIGDKKARTFSEDEEHLLTGLAAVVMEELEEMQQSGCH